MEATIEIKEMLLRGHHGVLAQERAVGNDFAFTLRLRYRVDEAVESDDISAAINYAGVIDTVKSVNAIPSNLLEHLAARVRDKLIENFPQIDGGMVRVAKLMPPIPGVKLAGVSVEIEW